MFVLGIGFRVEGLLFRVSVRVKVRVNGSGLMVKA